MLGSYSIKYVLPTLLGEDNDQINYKSLNLVQNGTDAMNTYPKLANPDKVALLELIKAKLIEKDNAN